MNVEEFREIIWQKGRELYRDMPWRADTDPYSVLVSELMLQQTQVDRVIPKFNQFMAAFPNVGALAGATMADVLKVWSGLGYNRRAKFLHQAAQKIVDEHGGDMPATIEGLVTLPGVGPNTAGAVLAYSFNKPTVFVETNVRTVYFHHFFGDQEGVTDGELRALVEETVDHEHPREWYWALMDYGAFLKRQGAGRISQSKHYKKQAPLKGSLREVRGMIVRLLGESDMTRHDLAGALPADDRAEVALQALLAEGIIDQTGERLHLRR